MSRNWVAMTVLILALGMFGSAWAAGLDGPGQNHVRLLQGSELLGVVMAGGLVWRARSRTRRPIYSRLATTSINCRPVGEVSRRC